jgi:hypothetical protein
MSSKMTRRRAGSTVLEKSVAKIDMRFPGKMIYVFRCNKRGLYALTADPEGRMLPSQMCPEITWGFEQALTFRVDGNSWRDSILKVTLDRAAEHGFHLIHAALYGELLGRRESATVH